MKGRREGEHIPIRRELREQILPRPGILSFLLESRGMLPFPQSDGPCTLFSTILPTFLKRSYASSGCGPHSFSNAARKRGQHTAVWSAKAEEKGEEEGEKERED